MSRFPLSLLFFTSTKGHWGRKYIFQETIADLEKKFGIHSFASSVAHIKHSGNESDLLEEITDYTLKRGFGKILTSHGTWNHIDIANMGKEYYKDMGKVLNDPYVLKNEFCLHLEDDWLFNCESVDKYLHKAIVFLKNNPNCLCVRFNNQDEHIEPHQYHVSITDDDIFFQSENYSPYGPTVTFQPTVFRTRDWRNAVNLILDNLEVLGHTHSEIISGESLKKINLNKTKTPFAFFNPKVVSVKHIGVPIIDEA